MLAVTRTPASLVAVMKSAANAICNVGSETIPKTEAWRNVLVNWIGGVRSEDQTRGTLSEQEQFPRLFNQ